MRKAISLMLTFMLVLSMTAVPVFASETYVTVSRMKEVVLEAFGLEGTEPIEDNISKVTRIQTVSYINTIIERIGLDFVLSENEINSLIYKFPDIGPLSVQQREDLAICVKLGIFGGNKDGTMAPNKFLLEEHLGYVVANIQVALVEKFAGFTGVVNIIHVNDIHTTISESDTAIGIAKIAGFAENLKAENPNTLFLDAGDSFSGTQHAVIDKAESLMPIFNTVGFDVMVAGNHDFSYGSAHLLKLVDMANYPVLCGNMIYHETGEAILDGYVIKVLPNGLRVGIVGVTTPESAVMGAIDLKYVDAIEVAQELIDEVAPQVDIVVGLFHVGDTETFEMTSVMLAEQLSGVDVIIDGHSHTTLPNGRVENGVLIAQAGEYAQHIGVVDLVFENGVLKSTSARLVSKSDADQLPEKEETAELLEEFEVMSDAYFAEIIGETSVQLIGTRDIIRTQETNLGNLFSDVLTAKAEADFGLFIAGPMGGEVGPGPISRKDLTAIARVNSMVMTKAMSGADVLDLLNYYCSFLPAPSGQFTQASGISFVIDIEQEKERVFNVKVGDEPLDLDKVYEVALFIGSNDLPGAVNGEFLGEVGYSMEILAEYIANNSPIYAEVEGRITIGTKSE